MKIHHFVLSVLSFALLSNASAALDYGAPATSVEEAKASVEPRMLSLAHQMSAEPIGPHPIWPKVYFGEFFPRTIARLITRTELDKVSEALLAPSFQPWKPGTDIAIAGSLCKRKGDYDFLYMGLLKLAYLDEEAGQTLLTGPARDKLRNVLLSAKGNKHHITFKLDFCPPFNKRDSENHILMTEVSRYLTNQLVGIDNEANGFNAWLMEHVSEFMRLDYDEVNSKPYQGYTLIPLSILYDYARDARVKTTARMLLDYLSAKTAVQSVGLRRYTPFRRQRGHRDDLQLHEADNTMDWYAGLTGNFDFLKLDPSTGVNHYMFFMGITSKYRVPDSILSLSYDRPEAFQRINGRDVEAYYMSPSFTLTAGGAHRKVFGFFTGENDVWAMPTTIIPKAHGTRVDQLFRIVGREHGKRNNMCMVPNFACGENFVEPEGIPASCKRSVNGWTFYDMGPTCSANWGFQLAVKQVGNRVLWEVREAADMDAFVEAVVANNPAPFKENGVNTYVTSTGKSVVFEWGLKSRKHSPIISYDGVAVEREFKKWPLAEGDVLNSGRDGLITIQNPLSREVISLDGRDPLRPVITE